MSFRIAFVGFRHGHINSLYNLARERDDLEIVAACEEDVDTRAALDGGDIVITHDNYASMLANVECDIIACGDYYGVRGDRLLAALEAGRHVISDKPLCTTLYDLEQIQHLSRDRKLRVGLMLDLVDSGVLITLRDIIRRGDVGEVHAVTFCGQHPLNYGKRPMWYFEEGKHGGTINDIAIHAIDAMPWLTGHDIVEITAARVWNARLKEHPEFQDGAMLMLRLANNAGVMGDVSYLVPEAPGFSIPFYWRITVSGSEGAAEALYTLKTVTLWRKGAKEPVTEPTAPDRKGGYLEDFLSDIAGTPNEMGLTTRRVLHSSHIALLAQRAGETGAFPCDVPR